MFNDKTNTILAHSKVAFRRWLLSTYAFLRLNASLRRLQREIGATYKTIYRRAKCFARALNTPQPDLVRPIEINEVYASIGLKGRGCDRESRSRGLSTRGRNSYEGDRPPIFTIVNRGTGQRYVVLVKSANEPTVRLFFADHEGELLTVYTDELRVYDPLEDDDEFYREYVIHGDDEYAGGNVHVNTCESHALLARR